MTQNLSALRTRWQRLRAEAAQLSAAELARRVDELLALDPDGEAASLPPTAEPSGTLPGDGFRLESSADWQSAAGSERTEHLAGSEPRRAVRAVPGADTLAAPTEEPMPGLPEVPGYVLLRELGRGGMGVVYRARQRGLDRIVALKMLLGGRFAAPEQEARFRAEAQAVAQLVHPHIVQVHEIGAHDGRHYFSLEYVGGPTLDRVSAGQPQPPTDAARLVATLARAIHFAHLRGILHRDLKPANVLLSHDPAEGGPPPVPKITDFGLAKRLEEDQGHTRTGDIIGTPCYMPPEQASGKHALLGPAVDVYSLGAILYELLTGRPPFRGVTAMDTVMQVMTEPVVAPSRLVPKLPRDLETICLKCLSKEPGQRYLTAEALADDLDRFLNHEPIQARPASAWDRFRSWGKRNPTKLVILGLAVLGIIRIVSVDVIYRSTELQRQRDQAEQAAIQAWSQTKQWTVKVREDRRRFVELLLAEGGAQRLLANVRHLADLDPKDGAWLLELAGVALGLPPRVEAQAASDLAFDLVQKADQAGWFTEPGRLEQLDQGSTLAPLRERDDFKTWRQQAGSRSSPGP